MFRILSILCCCLFTGTSFAQSGIQWTTDGQAYWDNQEGNIVKVNLPANQPEIIVSKEKLIPAGASTPLPVKEFSISADGNKFLLFTNTRKVWRYETRGDYWVYDRATGTLQQLGKGLPEASLMFAKISPDGSKAAYVSGNNLYVETLGSNVPLALTSDGSRQRINGTFDWAYEEEFFCRDGFRWSPDSRQIAFWQINANKTPDYLMVNNTDSIYPVAIRVEYPVAGIKPSSFRIGVLPAAGGQTVWMAIPYDEDKGNYAPRMEWAANSNEVIVQYLDRKQQDSKLLLCNAASGTIQTIYHEHDSAWIDIQPSWDQDYANGGWDWLNGGKEFLWVSEKDGWRHIYRVSRDGKKETLLTKGNIDLLDLVRIDEKGNYVYYIASPENATQRYLYRSRLDGKGNAERVSPATQQGSHDYDIGPNALFAKHRFSNYYTKGVEEFISLKDQRPVTGSPAVADAVAKSSSAKSNLRFFQVTTADGITMDAWMAKPANFDSTKKYPVLFMVYTEPWGQTVKDSWGTGYNYMYRGNFLQDGYIYVSIDNRGTPVPKGRAWRKSVYRKIGIVNIRDQAMGAREILKLPYVDSSRVAVWGWSGGGSATLNLMFQYPEIYKTGIAVAAVGNQLTYDNIYQERYMGLPQENLEDFVKGSPITYAKNLKGNLLYIHGTGDDNVHYNNAEMLFNELIKYNRQFQMMSYPNRTHSISEGEGTFLHLTTLFTEYLRKHCPPGGR
ncbi:S9 family peptidase [Flavihumibacter petaseus]|uniref:Peptidase S9 family protein n=1 Tax=Flavihumibacter petaseus NBRC 106054 TaxID=1220578 RepID=A0A0E9N3H6_9BACT|nr:DPP IV N-terminal domain-containing protein [Flavihumibacter petaseus]GAO44236.1 peptidase S9 family protein [Flavihumibacter petaseus NBRC 106054]